MEVNVTVQKKICNIVFDNEDHYLRDFAEQLALNGFNVSQAFNKAYKKINKIRASYALQEPTVWKHYFEKLKSKPNKMPTERKYLELYDQLTETFDMDPFSLYKYYVEILPDSNQPLASLISSSPAKDFTVLIYLHKFFEDINRIYFLRKVEDRIANDYAQVIAMSDAKECDRIHRLCKSLEVDIEEIIEPKKKTVQGKLEL
jgi:hypothetical protein